MDIYTNFEHLRQQENHDAYEIELCDRGSAVSIIAPHGGNIEPGTTELAHLIAGEHFNYYSFTACKDQNSPDLHITSHNFDEPQCLALAKRSETIITVHGFKSDQPMIYLGGLNKALRQTMLEALQKAGLPAADDHWKYKGINPNNICNRSQAGHGVQLEFSRHIRGCKQQRQLIADILHSTLQHYKSSLVAG